MEDGVARIEHHQEEYRADHIKKQVDEGGALGVFAGPRAGEQGSQGGADVLAHDEGDGGIVANGAGGRQRLQNAREGSRALEHGGKDRAHQHTQHGVGESGEQPRQPGLVLEGGHSGGHGVHPNEQKAHAQDDLANVALMPTREEHIENNAHHSQQRT